MIPVIFAMASASAIPLFVVCLAAAVLGGWELGTLTHKDAPKWGATLAAIQFAIIGYVIVFHSGSATWQLAYPAMLLAAALGVFWIRSRSETSSPHIDMSVATMWVVAPLLALLAMHVQFPSNSSGAWRWDSPIMLAVLPIWAGDTAGMLVGKWIGKHPLAKNISPKKTVEGSIANLIAATAVAAWIGPFVGVALAPALACGAIAGSLGQAGDLFESWIKRRSGVKDSGDLLPGHGGLLDRIDSLLFSTIPIAWLITVWR